MKINKKASELMDIFVATYKYIHFFNFTGIKS